MKPLTIAALVLVVAVFHPSPKARAGAASLAPVTESNWGLKIVVFDVGQGDGTLLLARNGEGVIIDAGKTKAHGEAIADYLLSQTQNGVATIDTVEFIFASHYDADHIGGIRGLNGKIKAKAAYDQGPSASRMIVDAAKTAEKPDSAQSKLGQ